MCSLPGSDIGGPRQVVALWNFLKVNRVIPFGQGTHLCLATQWEYAGHLMSQVFSCLVNYVFHIWCK